jgi:hypothetical protein
VKPKHVQNLVTQAFCLEAISDKKGCTSRYVDMPGKPLKKFIIAGIKSGQYFRLFAEDFKKHDGNIDIFHYFCPTISDSNKGKFINMGLLEIMFPTVYARLTEDDPSLVVPTIVEVMKKENNQDVRNMLDTRAIAWRTSVKPSKRDFDATPLMNEKSPFDFYMTMMGRYEESHSNFQWAKQYKEGLPILRRFFEDFRGSDQDLLDNVRDSFNQIRPDNPEMNIGIIADMCAAAIFLHLSYDRS